MDNRHHATSRATDATPRMPQQTNLATSALVAVGFALLRLWIIYSQNLAVGVLGAEHSAELDATVLLSGALTALVLALARPRPATVKVLACAAFALACPLMMASQPDAPTWLAPIGLVAAGLATGTSYVLFGLFFVRLGVRLAIGAMAGTVVVASLVCAVLAFLSPGASMLVTGVIPVVLVAIVFELATRLAPDAAANPVNETPTDASTAVPARTHGTGTSRLLRLLVALCVNNVVIRMLDGVVYAQGRTGVTVFVCFAAQFAVGAVVLALFALSAKPVRRLGLAYRCVLPVMAVGFLCLALWQSPTNAVSMALIYFSHELFEIAFWVALVALAASSHRPEGVLGLGIGGVLASMAAGQAVGRWLFAGSLEAAASTLTLIALVCVVGLLMVTIVVLPENLILAIVQGADSGPDASPGASPGANQQRDLAVASLAANHGLTPRETDVLVLLARGCNVPAVMERLGISRGTANTHVANIYKKLDVHSQQDVIELVQGAMPGCATDSAPHD